MFDISPYIRCFGLDVVLEPIRELGRDEMVFSGARNRVLASHLQVNSESEASGLGSGRSPSLGKRPLSTSFGSFVTHDGVDTNHFRIMGGGLGGATVCVEEKRVCLKRLLDELVSV